MRAPYVPNRGDVVCIHFNPQAGHEQAGHRPALVLSPSAYNGRGGPKALLCPITSQARAYPFEVPVPDSLRVSGVILSDQVRSLDWRACRATFLDRVPEPVTVEVLRKLHSLMPLH